MSQINRTEADWREKLSPEQYAIDREKGTEQAFTGEYYNFKPETGMFHCVCCNAVQFDAQTKYDSGLG